MSRTCTAKFHRIHGYRPDETEACQCELERGHSARGFNHCTTYINERIIFWRGKEIRSYLIGMAPEPEGY
jgi:hypothetical protein